ncbi:hypothetical protein [Paenibacillus montanisoli]|uniref:Uncharacterized protein n=1 Tax=Paenibacillus montanisoli TaxID=2081970 RepID=A0A328U0D9_9BACL|nr:hypothetical protein [Paenibacillus montanisoli]RAP76110.1 hypothetical protein DL346_11860 [Paenibacillus montanisoli]
MSSSQFINKVPQTVTAPIPVKVTGVGSGNTRFLMVDNPETITQAHFSSGNLQVFAHDQTPGTGGWVKYRVFIWALNQTGVPLRMGITVGNGNTNGETYQIQNFKCDALNTSGDYLTNVGLPLAKALIAGTLDMDTTPVEATVPPMSVRLVHETTVTNGKLKGLVCEFEIFNPSGENMVYKVRVVASTSSKANLRNTQAAPIALSGPHPRGCWPWSEQVTPDITYTLGNGSANFSFANGDEVNGDDIYLASNSYDPTKRH